MNKFNYFLKIYTYNKIISVLKFKIISRNIIEINVTGVLYYLRATGFTIIIIN